MIPTPRVAESNEFDVYQTDAGYVAVTNEVRRKILTAVSKKERDLTELMKITGKAKPTLSNLHVKELLAQNLLAEIPHPTDARKKIYRMKGQRIGSSNVPIDQLRGAVKHYVSLSPLAHAVPIQGVLDILLAAGPSSGAMVQRQAIKLGELSSHILVATDVRDLLPRVAGYWEREGITRTAKIDLEHLAVEAEVNPRYAGSKESLALLAHALAGFLQGVLSKRPEGGAASGEPLGTGRVRVAVRA